MYETIKILMFFFGKKNPHVIDDMRLGRNDFVIIWTVDLNYLRVEQGRSSFFYFRV